jgi:hypothetical protein
MSRLICLHARSSEPDVRRIWVLWLPLCCVLCASFDWPAAQAQEDVQEKVRQLTEAMSRVQTQLNESQRQLDEMRKELAKLQGQKPADDSAAEHNAGEDAAKLAAQVEELRERQSMQEEQIAVQDQTKVESESKYPVKVSGMVLMNGFVNTRNVDVPAMPTLALPGGGTTGATLRQTILGVDIRGPHVLGARSHGDVRVDFDGGVPAGTGYAGGAGTELLRLRTAHAILDWEHTEMFFSLDRPLLSPNVADSLTAVAEPPLAWSGNLWSWDPQFGIAQDISIGSVPRLRMQAALIDVGDAPYTANLTAQNGAFATGSTAEASRWPGVEARVAVPGGEAENGVRIGAGGFFAPHRTVGDTQFDSWAGSLDLRLPLSAHMTLSGNSYRGQGLGGMGGGAYKDYVFGMYENRPFFRALDDVGGWVQWQQKIGERLEFNEAVGIDNVPAHELRPYAAATTSVFQNLARNRTATGNVIYSPSAYLLFSLEYRRLESSSISAPTNISDIIGVAAGFKF